MSNITQYKQDDYVLCPFFARKGKDSVSIKCEGLVGSHTIHTFRNKSECLTYMDDFCKSYCYAGCLHYIALDSKYEDG